MYILKQKPFLKQIEEFGSLQIGGEQSFQYMGEQEDHFDCTRGHGTGSKFIMGYQKTQRLVFFISSWNPYSANRHI